MRHARRTLNRPGRPAWRLAATLAAWASLAGLAAQAAQVVQLQVAPWFGHGAVLQQPWGSERPDQTVVWGWATKGDVVTVQFGERGEPLKTEEPPRNGFGSWRLTYGRLRGRTLPGGSFDLVIASRKYPAQTLRFTNVVFGDLWVFGQQEGRGVAVPAASLEAIRASAAGRVRLLRAPSVDWTNNLPALARGWRGLDDPAALTGELANVTLYFAGRLAGTAPGQPLGLIVVPWETALPLSHTAPEPVRAPEVRRAYEAALAAGRDAWTDCQALLDHYPQQILQLKREGRTLEKPGRPVEPPKCLHDGEIPSLGCPVRGAIW